ncbi:MAG: hypothetical protein K2Y37_11395 [Pirellulales bacterium]|nr:hypothetical protein [Pirellulales bacterium]
MNRTLVAVFVLGLSLVSPGWSPAAGLIDFESAPGGGLPSDDAPLSVPYPMPGGGSVQLFFDVNGNNTYDSGIDAEPIFEASGPDAINGFANTVTGVPDTANGGLASLLGSFFLRQVTPGTIPPPLVIDYASPVAITDLSGEIWDIDGQEQATERWKVEILDASNAFLTGQLSPIGNTGALDGLPWTFSFTGLPSGVDKIRITFVGTKISGLGLAFNNFTPIQAVPEPSGIVLAGGGVLALLAAFGARRRGAVTQADDSFQFRAT